MGEGKSEERQEKIP